MDVLIDRSLVGILKAAEVLVDGLLIGDDGKGICPVCRSGQNVELCGFSGILALKEHFPGSHGNIESVIVVNVVLLAINYGNTVTTDVDGSQFPSLKQVCDTEVLPRVNVFLNIDCLINRHTSHCHDSVNM